EGSAIMQQRVIVHELDVAGAKFHVHVESWIVGVRIETIKRLDLPGRERGNVWKASRAFDVLPLIDDRQQIGVPVEDGDAKIRFRALRNLPAPVGFDWRKERCEEIRA